MVNMFSLSVVSVSVTNELLSVAAPVQASALLGWWFSPMNKQARKQNRTKRKTAKYVCQFIVF